VAEQSGLIVPLGRWVLRAACAQGRIWQDAHRRTTGEALSVTVNVSVTQLLDADLVPRVAAILAETGFDPTALVLEVTESLFLQDRVVVRQRLEALRALGPQIALDDFGTGYSSLAYLHEFAIDVIKIDRSFVEGIGVDPRKSALVRSLAVLARSLELRTVAEGVETEAQCAAVKEYGYDYAQGYLFARPLTAAAFTATLRLAPPDCVVAS
jgi:EAL domain-containing protein (putative c-di-GMP-specific phosphodiesterase class I)